MPEGNSHASSSYPPFRHWLHVETSIGLFFRIQIRSKGLFLPILQIERGFGAMVSFGGGPSGFGAMNGALGGSGGMNRNPGPPGTGTMNGMNSLPGKGGANGIDGPPGTRGMDSTRFSQPEPTGPNQSTASSSPPVWRRGREFPIDKATGKIDRRAVGGTAGQNGIERDGDLFIIESMGSPGRPFNPFQRDLQTFWANRLLRPRARKLFWKPFDESARWECELWEVATEGRRGWLRRRR